MGFRWLSAPLSLALLCVAPKTLAEGFIDVLLFGGQSNIGPSGGVHLITDEALFPESVLMFEKGRLQYGTSRPVPESIATVGPAFDRRSQHGEPLGQTLGVLSGFALAGQLDSSHKYFVRTDWYGGQPLTAFLPGTTSWENLRTSVSASQHELLRLGYKPRYPAYVWFQGESGSGAEGAYGPAACKYLTDAAATIQSITNQPFVPQVLYFQVGSGADFSVGNEVPLSQAALQENCRPLAPVLVGPVYQFPLADKIHFSSLARMGQADLLASIYQKVVSEHKRFDPLRPTASFRAGRHIFLLFNSPRANLEFDTEWVAPTKHFGFHFEDSDNSAFITNVEILLGRIIHITLNRSPSGADKVIRYALDNDPLPGWNAARGQLMYRTNEPSFFRSKGFDVRPTVMHYGISFAEPIN